MLYIFYILFFKWRHLYKNPRFLIYFLIGIAFPGIKGRGSVLSLQCLIKYTHQISILASCGQNADAFSMAFSV